MTQWDDRVLEHEVWEKLRQMGPALLRASAIAKSTEAHDGVARLRLVRDWVEATLEAVDPLLLPPQLLQGLTEPMRQFLGEVQNYVSNQNPGHITNANGHADAVLHQLRGAQAPQNEEHVSGLRRSIVSLRRSVGQYKRYVEAERDGMRAPVERLKTELADLQSEIAGQKGRLDQAIAEFQSQFSEAEQRRRAEFAEGDKAREERFRQEIAAHRTRLEQAEKDWEREQAAREEEYQKEAAERKEELEKSYDELLRRIDDEGAALLHSLEEHKTRAQDLVHVIANTGMVGGYQSIANRHRRAALVWQVIAALSLLGLIGFAVYAFTATSGDAELMWTRLGGRAFVAVTFGILSGYAARQADRREQAAEANRQTELALASVDPYLVGMPEDLRNSVKSELSRRFFAPPPSPTSVKQRKVTGTSSDLLRMALEIMGDLAKKAD